MPTARPCRPGTQWASTTRLLFPARLPDAGLPLWLVDCPALFAREGGLYCDGDGRDWADDHLHFALLCHAGARLAAGQGPAVLQAELGLAVDPEVPLFAFASRLTAPQIADEVLAGGRLGKPPSDPEAGKKPEAPLRQSVCSPSQ